MQARGISLENIDIGSRVDNLKTLIDKNEKEKDLKDDPPQIHHLSPNNTTLNRASPIHRSDQDLLEKVPNKKVRTNFFPKTIKNYPRQDYPQRISNLLNRI